MSNWIETPDGIIAFERLQDQAESDGRLWTHEDKIIDRLFSRRFVPVEELRRIAWRETSRRSAIVKLVGRPIFEKRSRKREGGQTLLDWRLCDADAMIFEQIRKRLVAAIANEEVDVMFEITFPLTIENEVHVERTRTYHFSAELASEEARDPKNVDETARKLFKLYVGAL